MKNGWFVAAMCAIFYGMNWQITFPSNIILKSILLIRIYLTDETTPKSQWYSTMKLSVAHFTFWWDLGNPPPHSDSGPPIVFILFFSDLVAFRSPYMLPPSSNKKKRALERYIEYLTTWLRSAHTISLARTSHMDELRYSVLGNVVSG